MFYVLYFLALVNINEAFLAIESLLLRTSL